MRQARAPCQCSQRHCHAPSPSPFAALRPSGGGGNNRRASVTRPSPVTPQPSPSPSPTAPRGPRTCGWNSRHSERKSGATLRRATLRQSTHPRSCRTTLRQSPDTLTPAAAAPPSDSGQSLQNGPLVMIRFGGGCISICGNCAGGRSYCRDVVSDVRT